MNRFFRSIFTYNSFEKYSLFVSLPITIYPVFPFAVLIGYFVMTFPGLNSKSSLQRLNSTLFNTQHLIPDTNTIKAYLSNTIIMHTLTFIRIHSYEIIENS